MHGYQESADNPDSPRGSEPRPRDLRPAWVATLKRFETPSLRKAAWQLANTLVPYLGLLALMYLTVSWGAPYWITVLLAAPAGAMLVRLFILFHDCVHGSFVASPLGCEVIGHLMGILTFTPYADWRRSHGIHHSTSGNLDRRGVGDIWTMTAEEYGASPPLRRLQYRLFRNPIVMFGVGPFYTFIITNRWPNRGASRKQILSVIITNLAIAGIVVAASLTAGIKAYLLVQMPIMLLGGAGGVWLFYVQHQFDPSYWCRSSQWESMEAAMQGSSYYRLPRVLQWITGNIGLHHIHHLRPRIPNYNLQQCLDETPELQLPNPLRLWASLKSVRLKVWDERTNGLLTFGELCRKMRQRPNLA